MNTQPHHLMKKTRNAYHFQIRKCKKMKDILKKNSFLRACIDNKSTDLFKAIRSLRRSAPMVPNTIDGKSEDIPDHFAGIYGIYTTLPMIIKN